MSEAKLKLHQINQRDNVAVALYDVPAGYRFRAGETELVAKEDIPFGHKTALRAISAGEEVIKYGSSIGRACADIQPGEWVHSHNLKTGLEGKLDYAYEPAVKEAEDVSGVADTFEGFLRASGEVGIRNEIWVIPTVSCVNPTVRELARRASDRHTELADGIHAFPHNTGCSQMGDDEELSRRILTAIIKHPNAGAVLLVGLGCENSHMDTLLPYLGDYDRKRIRTMVTQEVEDELKTGLAILDELAALVAAEVRVPLPVSKLRIGMKCGGSDAFSGVTANPLCGRISDRLCALGGTTILTEVPEMFGAEKSLMDRAADEAVFGKVVNLINGFKQYYIDYDQPIYENPSPGNKKGGITTLEEKSLGCIQKGGHATVTDTLDYGQMGRAGGLNLAIGPGNDSVSITNLVASGAHMILFTTGRGNPLGTAVPAVKISSNTPLYERKGAWIDYNAGVMLEGKAMDEMRDELWHLVLEVASGRRKTRNEINDFREIMVFKNGVML